MRVLLSILVLISISGCPSPQEENCGQGMVLVDETCECVTNAHLSNDGESCECDSLYHWSEELSNCALDTTSSQFTWTLDTFGIYSTIFRDVEIVDENNIWVVGHIRNLTADSSGENKYNAVHWDGGNWEFIRINGSSETYGIMYYSDTDIWVTSGAISHWNGFEWEFFHLWNMGILNPDEGGVHYCWGTSSDSMYFVGGGGTIVHYDGTSFTKIESGTDINLYSVSGTPDGEYVFACGANNYYESIILQISNQQVEVIYEGTSSGALPAGAPRASYVYGDTAYFASGIGVWKFNFMTDSSSVVYENDSYEHISARAIQATTPNDVFLCGARSEFVHFNGVRWTSDFSVWGQFGYSGVASYGMDVDGDMVVIVGYCYGSNQGLIARGRRN